MIQTKTGISPPFCGIAFVVCLSFSLVSSAPLYAQLVGYWTFDDNVMDSSVNGNNGTLNGGTYSTNIPSVLSGGKSLDINSVNNADHVLVPANASLDSNVFTLSAFINNRGQIGGINRISSRGGDSFEVGINRALGPGDGQLSYFPGWVLTPNIPAMNTWQHIALVADGSNITVYADGAPVHGPTGFTANPNGNLRIGSRENGPGEGFNGLIDDFALFNAALTPSDIEQLADGLISPLDITPPPPPPMPTLTVTSNLADWSMSTVTEPGGPAGEWTPSGNAPPDASTFTVPAPTINPARTNITNAASALGVEAIGAGIDVQFHRTTFNLDPFIEINATYQLAVDNGAQVYINGELVGTETSFVVDNWAFPLPGLTINEGGSISDISKLESAPPAFTGFVPGENEIILAIRNPGDEDPLLAGGFAFKMDVFATPIPEPTTMFGLIMAMLACMPAVNRRRRSHR